MSSSETTALPLQTTLSSAFVPGTNVRGEIAGANWAFLLPSLELDLAVCVGRTAAPALATLSRLADRVAVVATASGRRETLEWAESTNASNVFAVRAGDLGSLRRADAVYLVDPGRFAALDDLVSPRGVVYAERRRPPRTGAGRVPLALHLTPRGGEMRTAVPLADPATIEYFARHGLHGPTFDRHAAKRRFGGAGGGSEGRAGGAVSEPGAGAGGSRGGGRRVLREIGRLLLDGAARAEAEIARRRSLRWLARRATLLRPGGESPGPPRYLREIARGFDIDIDRCRWGLAAHGQYRSRKVLFFLFDAEAPAGAPPRWIVKLTRDPALNGRLENLAHALEAIHEIPGLETRRVPRAAFHGHHAGLMIVAEEAVAGAPFRTRTSWNAECVVAANAVEWLGELAAATADPAPAAATAEALRRVLDRFTSIYDVDEGERRFLAEQIATVSGADAPIPLVFQHGDPGTWNLLANEDGRVAFLDWEAAEFRGLPLWDLFYFLRSFAVGCARASGRSERQAAVEGLLADGPIGRMFVRAVERYRERTGLDAVFVEPLFHTCWMHRALKEATRLAPERLGSAQYLALLRLGIARRESPTLRRLFGL